jgi:hypothetical protein
MNHETLRMVLIVALVAISLWILLFARMKFKVTNIIKKGTLNRITLFPLEPPPIKNAAKFGEAADAFRGLGFSDMGTFGVKEMPGTVMLAMYNSEKDFTAVVYEHPAVGVFSEVLALYEDGGAVTAGNAPQGGNLDWPEDRIKMNDKGADPKRLFEFVSEYLDRKPLRRVGPDNFASVYEGEYAKVMDWRLKRGGATKEEIRRVAASMGKTGVTESAIEAAAKIEELKAAMQLSRMCLENFMKQGGLPSGMNPKTKLVAVHDKLPMDGALAYLAGGSRTEGLKLATEVEQGSMGTRDLFRRVNGKVPLERQFTYIGNVREPVEADIYMKS